MDTAICTLILINKTEIKTGQKIDSAKLGTGQAQWLQVEESYSSKLKTKWIKDFKIKPNILNRVEEKVRNNLEIMNTGK